MKRFMIQRLAPAIFHGRFSPLPDAPESGGARRLSPQSRTLRAAVGRVTPCAPPIGQSTLRRAEDCPPYRRGRRLGIFINLLLPAFMTAGTRIGGRNVPGIFVN